MTVPSWKTLKKVNPDVKVEAKISFFLLAWRMTGKAASKILPCINRKHLSFVLLVAN
jgi:hypothetical protein